MRLIIVRGRIGGHGCSGVIICRCAAAIQNSELVSHQLTFITQDHRVHILRIYRVNHRRGNTFCYSHLYPMQQGVQLKKAATTSHIASFERCGLCAKPLLVVASSSSRHLRITTSIPTTHLEAQSTTTRMLNDLPVASSSPLPRLCSFPHFGLPAGQHRFDRCALENGWCLTAVSMMRLLQMDGPADLI